MHDPVAVLALVAFAFFLAGTVKGVIGLGLPTVAIGLSSLVMTPAEAAAILVLPSLVSNIWQSLTGPHLRALLRRMWPLLVAMVVGTLAGTGQLTGDSSGRAVAALGVALMLYAITGLTPLRMHVPPRAEVWLAPLVGVATGLISAATGVFVIPGVPYVQALGFERDQLVQALGISFTVSTLALAVVLAHGGALHPSMAGASLTALAAALLGMLLGQQVRARVRPDVFRLCFFIGLLLLGAHLALRRVL